MIIMKCLRYRKIKKVRIIISEIMQTDNIGRALYLLKKLPNVDCIKIGFHDYYYKSGNAIIVCLYGGFEYSFSGYGNPMQFIKQAALFVYFRWIKHY